MTPTGGLREGCSQKKLVIVYRLELQFDQRIHSNLPPRRLVDRKLSRDVRDQVSRLRHPRKGNRDEEVYVFYGNRFSRLRQWKRNAYNPQNGILDVETLRSTRKRAKRQPELRWTVEKVEVKSKRCLSEG